MTDAQLRYLLDEVSQASASSAVYDHSTGDDAQEAEQERDATFERVFAAIWAALHATGGHLVEHTPTEQAAPVGQYGVVVLSPRDWMRVLNALEQAYCAPAGTPPPSDWFSRLTNDEVTRIAEMYQDLSALHCRQIDARPSEPESYEALPPGTPSDNVIALNE